MTDVSLGIPRRLVEFTLDGEQVRAPEGSTILDACTQVGTHIPTLCWGDTLSPVNACRVCMVEVEGSRTLVPSCSRAVDPGMVVTTNGERARHSRKLVLELLASSVDLSTTPHVSDWIQEYGAQPARFGPPADAATNAMRDGALAGEHHVPDGSVAATVAQPTRIDNDLYVRDYGKCILCYKFVDACGEQWQNSFAITVAGRGFDARISTEFAVPLPESACVLRQLRRGLSDRCAQHQAGVRPARPGQLGRGGADNDDDRVQLLRCEVQPRIARAGQQDLQGHLAARPQRHAREPLH